jgi:hypothetical protein
MTEKSTPPERFSLSRWSRRKLEASAEAAGPAPAAPANAMATAPASAPSTVPAAALELPSVDSLNFDSDFTAFLRPEVDERLKHAALKQLFRDARFNVMDGLDVYIDDYTKADPIEPGVLKQMLERFSAVGSTSASPAEEPARLDAPAATPAASAPPAPPLPAATAAGAEPDSAATEGPPEESSAPHSPS